MNIKTNVPAHIIVAETLCMIYRYCYYVKGEKVVTDYFYDRLEELVTKSKFLPKSPLRKPGSSNISDYNMTCNHPTIEMGNKVMEDSTYLDNLLEKVLPYLNVTPQESWYLYEQKL